MMYRILCILALGCVTLPVLADTEGAVPPNRIWLTWESRYVDPQLCAEKSYCETVGHYQTRLVETPSETQARQMMGALDQLATRRGYPAEHPDSPQMCRNVEAARVLGFDPESWEISDKLEALRGLEGVYFDVTGLRAPPGYDGPFGPRMQADMEARFAAVGLRVLTEEERDVTPGKPHLNIFFSHTNPDTGCWFSVFSSLTQTALLTRNHTVKFKAGTWGFSGGYDPDNSDRSEYDAILIVVDKFLADYVEANSRPLPEATETSESSVLTDG